MHLKYSPFCILLLSLTLSCQSSGTLATSKKATASSVAKPITKPTSKKSDYLKTLMSKIQKSWQQTKTFSSPFIQKVESKLIGTEEKSTGNIYVMKPNKLKWESKTDGSIQIINNNTLTYVQPEAQRGKTVVDKYRNFSKLPSAKIFDFLAGNVDLNTVYASKLLSKGKHVDRILLTPRKAGGESYVAEIDKKSYVLKALVFETEDTKRRMEFTKPEINQPMNKALFEYKIKPNDIVNYQ